MLENELRSFIFETGFQIGGIRVERIGFELLRHEAV
jgi:hypothetical protein